MRTPEVLVWICEGSPWKMSMRPILGQPVSDEPHPAPTSASGRNASFSNFYRAEQPGQVRRAALLVGSDATANDIVHDALTAMYQRWDTITDPGPYLNRAVLNGCRQVGRRRSADRKLVRRLRPQQDTNHDEILLDVLSRLPFNQRAVVVLRFYAGMTEREISEYLEVPAGSVGPWISRAATLPALTDVSSEVPPTVLGTGPTDWYRLQPDLDVAWYSDGGDQSMLCFRTPAGQDCQLDRFAPTASGGGPIGVRSVDDQLLVLTLDPASPVTVTFDNGQTVTRPFEADEQTGWGVARVQMPPAGNPEGLSMLFDTSQDGSASSAPPMTTVPTSEPVPSVAG